MTGAVSALAAPADLEMLVEPAGDEQCGYSAEDGADLGQPDQLIVGWCRHGCDRWATEAVVAGSRNLVEVFGASHLCTVARITTTIQSSARLNPPQVRALVTFWGPRSICVTEVLPFCDGTTGLFQRTYDSSLQQQRC